MAFILGYIRGLYKALSADATPTAIAAGMAFGIMAGSVPVTSRFGLFAIVLVLIVRVQLSSAIFAWVIVRALSVAGGELLFNPVGDALLYAEWLKPAWTWVLNLPVIAWLELERPAILGGVVLGFVLGAAMFLPVRLAVIAYRRWAEERLENNRFFRWLTSFWLVKGLRFILVGPGA